MQVCPPPDGDSGSRDAAAMKQIALDIGLASPPSLANFFAGPNEAALKHLELWAGNSLIAIELEPSEAAIAMVKRQARLKQPHRRRHPGVRGHLIQQCAEAFHRAAIVGDPPPQYFGPLPNRKSLQPGHPGAHPGEPLAARKQISRPRATWIYRPTPRLQAVQTGRQTAARLAAPQPLQG